MDLAALIQGSDAWCHGAAGSDARAGVPTIDIKGLSDDSREVRPGWLFIARPGTRDDGHRYIEQALAAGAVAILADAPPPADRRCSSSVAWVAAPSTPGLRVTAARLAERFYGNPSRHLALVGITGTNGKTTTAHLTQQILAHTSGRRCGLIGTVLVDDGVKREKARWTTPPSHELSRLLGDMVRHECPAAAMEVSSHALHQERVAALAYRAGVFTNLTGDHLDYHGTLEAYADAKAMLFASLDANAAAIVNAMDPHAERMTRDCRAGVWRCRIGELTSRDAECIAEPGPASMAGTRVRFAGPWGCVEALLPLVGRHNVMNALQAASAAWATGLVPSRDALADAIEHVEAPPGRLQRVSDADDPFLVLVDYAHTDDALRNILPTLRPLVAKSSHAGDAARLIVVFGCGGDRDRTKRPRMARAACELADEVWITSDNPRTESPDAIIEEILAGVPASSKARAASRIHVEPDRRLAIHGAVAGLRPGDCLVIAGKGHEEEQIVAAIPPAIGTRTLPFSDAGVAREALALKRGECVGVAGSSFATSPSALTGGHA